MAKLSLGQLIKRQREKRGLSLYALAEQANIDRAVLWRIESGDVTEPRPETLAKVAHVLGISVTQLYRSAGYRLDPLPDFKGYLRTKYGYLPSEQRAALVDFFEEIDAEFSPTSRSSATKKRKGAA